MATKIPPEGATENKERRHSREFTLSKEGIVISTYDTEPFPDSSCSTLESFPRISTVNYEPGFFHDTFICLQKAYNDLLCSDYAMSSDSIYINSGTMYRSSNGNYEGFVNYGDRMSAVDPNKIATEWLVFMFVSFQNHWKVPAGYVLCNSINATNHSFGI